MTALCFKCRRKVEIKDPRRVTLRNGLGAHTGTCPRCGKTVYRILKGGL